MKLKLEGCSNAGFSLTDIRKEQILELAEWVVNHREDSKKTYKQIQSEIEKESEHLDSSKVRMLVPFLRKMGYVNNEGFEQKNSLISLKEFFTDEGICFVEYLKMVSKIILLDKKDIEYAIYNKNEISIINEIRDAASLKPEGMLMTTYDVGVISDVIKKYKDTNSEVLILNKEGMVLYDSENKYDYEYYPYFDKLKVGRHEILLEDSYYVDILPDNNGLMSVVRIKVSNATKVPLLFKVSAFLVSLFLFIIAECVLYIKFKNLSSRMDSLVLAMEKVEKGDIDVHIPLSNDRDEITFIADNFNKMCEKLNDHIRKSYLAELRQREAEIVALQNQINPHFLYNTLESIRMKAICNGDKEVGKMLYSLAFLFRSQVKGNLIVSIDQEIKYCNKYLELFKFRYDEKFKFKIECEEDLYDKGIVKFTLQPLIENYFVHGIRLERDDNELKIYIYKHLEDIVVEVIDNGRGIPKEKLDDINRRIRECDHSGKSIGMLNVHERIKIKYGEPYGLTVTSEENKGTNMILKFPLREVE